MVAYLLASPVGVHTDEGQEMALLKVKTKNPKAMTLSLLTIIRHRAVWVNIDSVQVLKFVPASR